MSTTATKKSMFPKPLTAKQQYAANLKAGGGWCLNHWTHHAIHCEENKCFERVDEGIAKAHKELEISVSNGRFWDDGSKWTQEDVLQQLKQNIKKQEEVKKKHAKNLAKLGM